MPGRREAEEGGKLLMLINAYFVFSAEWKKRLRCRFCSAFPAPGPRTRSDLAEDFVAGIPDERSSFAEAVTTSSALLLFQFR